jgi:hypothetical protein
MPTVALEVEAAGIGKTMNAFKANLESPALTATHGQGVI